ncbi:MAG: hypothetical protein QXP59_05065, partial [Saccharolobus sp.]
MYSFLSIGILLHTDAHLTISPPNSFFLVELENRNMRRLAVKPPNAGISIGSIELAIALNFSAIFEMNSPIEEEADSSNDIPRAVVILASIAIAF